ncbi:unnamed protein product [Rotaria magnacalcarata]|uniref:Uncharacterized protein n=1 Tax=Rotaria magnacalcarata TaxID=392030 RepID=A0A816AZ22_9BILA|nr:unnamed protein product [Rotaria magnacalcarata]CAF1604519.1 unnamed protein product [Rotaria magnacalcarata]CAF2103421.1 unnamed protein product [Rotaria magnacalcarata]CAF2112729.1 unnamed protein product [Rotaria magnacalcarata]CAF2196216.1 unnamed protein product [Rotaria magnacalcarata]
MCDPAGVHITRIYINNSRKTPSPIRSSNTNPVCTSTPIIDLESSNLTSQQQMALIAKEILATRHLPKDFNQRTESPPQQQQQYVFISKETGHQIDFSTGEGIGKIANPSTGTISKKKKIRQTIATVPSSSSRSSKSSDDGDYAVLTSNEIRSSNEKKKTNFTSYDGIQIFTFTLDDD